MSRSTRTITLAVALTLAAGIGAGGGAGTYALLSSGESRTVVRQVTVNDAEPAAATSSLSVGEIYARARKGVVEITVTGRQTTPFGGARERQAQGSGFVIDNAGHVVTNEHVVSDASSISVRFWNGQTYDAEVIGTDPSTDVALLKVDAPSSLLAPLSFSDSDAVAVGDTVVAIGSPFGLEGTVTSGIVSALHRQITSPNNFTIDDSIQTDAAINHGNSGGPLLDDQGQVIGITAQIESDSGGNDGVGFAVPSNTVRSVVSQLLENGKVEHAYLGVGLETIPASVASQLGLVGGAEVTEVRSGTPAARAGLHGASGSRTVDGQPYPVGGDVITAVDGRRIASSDDLRRAIDAKKPGDTVSLTYSRGGRTFTVDVQLASRPS